MQIGARGRPWWFCRNYREDGSDFCAKHQDRPNFCLALKDFFRERTGKLVTEEDFRAWENARFPKAAQEFNPVYNFPDWISNRAVVCGFEIEGQTCKAQSAGGAAA